MPEQEQYDYTSNYLGEINTKIVDLDEKQKLLKARVLLIGQNLIETKESLDKDLITIKTSMEELKSDVKRIKDAILRLSEELENKARKSEVELLQKQAKIFQPLEFVRVSDLKK